MEDNEDVPSGKCVIYKMKDNGEFGGYYEGIINKDGTLAQKDSLIVFKNASIFEGLTDRTGIYRN